MGKHEKLLAKLKRHPKDFSFQEVVALLSGFGYALNQRGSGSRIRFDHEHYTPVLMHKPHPLPVLKPYQVDHLLDILRQENLL